MDNTELIKNWFEEFDYNVEDIQNVATFNNLSKGKMTWIWNEIINKVKNRSHVKKVKRNVLYHLLKRQSTEKDYTPLQLLDTRNQLCDKLKVLKEKITIQKHELSEKIQHISNLQLHEKKLEDHITNGRARIFLLRNCFKAEETVIPQYYNQKLSNSELKVRIESILCHLTKSLEYKGYSTPSKIKKPTNNIQPFFPDNFTGVPMTQLLSVLKNLFEQNIEQFNSLTSTATIETKSADVEAAYIHLCAFYNKAILKTNKLLKNEHETDTQRLHESCITRFIIARTKFDLIQEEIKNMIQNEISSNFINNNTLILRQISTERLCVKRMQEVLSNSRAELKPRRNMLQMSLADFNMQYTWIFLDIKSLLGELNVGSQVTEELNLFKHFPIDCTTVNRKERILLDLLQARIDTLIINDLKLEPIKYEIENINHLSIDTENEELLNRVLQDFHQVQTNRTAIARLITFWQQQPWQNLISKKRLFNGKNFQWYEQEYQRLLKHKII